MTLLEGDHVQFNISTDRRDKLERATNIDILPDTFHFTKESREMVRPTWRAITVTADMVVVMNNRSSLIVIYSVG